MEEDHLILENYSPQAKYVSTLSSVILTSFLGYRKQSTDFQRGRHNGQVLFKYKDGCAI